MPTPLKRALPTHTIDGRIKFAVVLSIARKERGIARRNAARTGIALPADSFTRVRDAMEIVRHDIQEAAAFHAVTNVPVYIYREVQRRDGCFAWTDHEYVGRISAEEEAAAKAAALEAARVRDAAPLQRAA